MIQAPAEPHELVTEIVATIVSRFQPRRVYLFGSRARGDARPDSDYDFLIEIDKAPEGITITRQRMTWLTGFPGAEIQIHVRLPGQLERRKDDPGTVDWDVLREGRLLFALPGVPTLYPSPTGRRVSEPNPLPQSLAGWLARAGHDLRFAQHLSANPGEWPNPICFYSQQSAEKFLKALIIAQSERPEHTHDLGKLLEHLRTLGFELPNLDADCARLTPYAVRTRYADDSSETAEATQEDARFLPDVVEFSEEDARQALPTAERIAAAVRDHLP